MDDSDLLKYDAAVPRYTSYPTAPHFAADVDEAQYRSWLGGIPREATLSLYVHVPFCASLCWFCGCQMRVVNRYGPVRDYLDLVATEVAQVADALPHKGRVTHTHFGGGTPTLISGPDFIGFVDTLRRHFDFSEAAEIAVEIDPRRFSRERAVVLGEGGVNRASLGIQDFDDEVQRAINRLQSFDETRDAVDWLRAAGITGISFDLLYGLPHQTEAKVLDSIDQALTLEPDRVSLFGYAHVPWVKPHQKLIDDSALPGPALRLKLYRSAARRLGEAGYVAVGLDHFARGGDSLAHAARAGQLRRNFQGYTTDAADALIGLGASALGTLPQGYVQNAPDVPAYRAAIRAGRFATVRGLALKPDDRVRREIISRLMCYLTVDLDDAARVPPGGLDPFADSLRSLHGLESDGLVRIDGRRITVPDEARPAVRAVCATFDSYLGTGVGRHSRAI